MSYTLQIIPADCKIGGVIDFTIHLALLFSMLFFRSNGAEPRTLEQTYADKGQLIIAQMISAPFPHPKRSEGHKYKEQLYSAAEHYQDSTVAIFIPNRFHETGSIDFVVHFHGWKNNVAGVLAKYRLIEQLAESRRNAILVIPQGPRDAPDSFGGKLEDAGGFARFMAEVRGTIRDKAALKKKDFEIGRIVLSGHSGGYQVISSILDHGGLTEHIAEVWLFDALYAQTDKFLGWFEKGNGRLLNIYTENGGTKKETEQMMALLKSKGMAILAGTETEMKIGELPRTGAVFIYSALEHDDLLHK